MTQIGSARRALAALMLLSLAPALHAAWASVALAAAREQTTHVRIHLEQPVYLWVRRRASVNEVPVASGNAMVARLMADAPGPDGFYLAATAASLGTLNVSLELRTSGPSRLGRASGKESVLASAAIAAARRHVGAREVRLESRPTSGSSGAPAHLVVVVESL